MNRIFICRVCGKDAHTFQQPGLVPGRKPVLQVECRTPDCANWKQTTDIRDLVNIDRRFIIEDDTSQDDVKLMILERRAVALKRLSQEQR